MNKKIVELMKQSQRDMTWLQDALQSAIELELSTLPPYLCGYWALKDKTSFPATQIQSIVLQEMLHFGLACNMLSATGKVPEVIKGYQEITYPGPLPGGVAPKCDPRLIPCDPQFKVFLGFRDFKAFALMCMQIEYPEDPAPRPALLVDVKTFPSIGEFYDAVLAAFRDNDLRIPYDVTNQQKGPLGLSKITNLVTAIAAIELIKQQGEGGDRNPYYGGSQLSHFYTFGEFYFGRKYVYNVTAETGDWIGDPVPIDDDQILEMTPIPEGGYPAPPQDVTDCDLAFTGLLKQLESAWSGGGSVALSAAIDSMGSLSEKAIALLGKQIRRSDAPGIYGPQFRLASTSVSVSFAKDIKPMFRPIDIDHMKPLGYALDDFTFMSDPAGGYANANAVFNALKNQDMPPGGPFWTQAQLDVFSSWMSGGYGS
jgi:hypothetical protein